MGSCDMGDLPFRHVGLAKFILGVVGVENWRNSVLNGFT